MIRNYCRIGINHHLIFPGVLNDAHDHERSLYLLLSDGFFDIIDMSFPDDREVRAEEIKMLSESEKQVIYNFPLFCLGSEQFDTNSPSKETRFKTLDMAKKHLDYAAEANISTVTFASGLYRRDIAEEEQLKAFTEYSLLFGEEAEKLGMTALLEPFDRSIGKNLLLGTADACVLYIERLRMLGCQNIALMQDMGHIPILGESFESTLKKCAPHLRHIHIGNCVIKDTKSKYYGDTHPPFGIDGGENDMDQLIEFTKCLKDIGYLYHGGKNSVTIEMQPYPGVSALTSARVGAEKFASALRAVFHERSCNLCK